MSGDNLEINWMELKGKSGWAVIQSRDTDGTKLEPVVYENVKILEVTDSFVIMILKDKLTIMKKNILERNLRRLSLEKKDKRLIQKGRKIKRGE